MAGSYNISIGFETIESGSVSNYNCAIGYHAMHLVDGGQGNVGLGYNPLSRLTSGNANIAFGNGPMQNLQTGSENVAIGTWTLNTNSSGSHNIAIGKEALRTTGDATHCVAIGVSALKDLLSGNDSNVALGYYALGALQHGERNVGIGRDAGSQTLTNAPNSAFEDCTYVGVNCQSGSGSTGAINEVVIGADAVGGGSWTASIGNMTGANAHGLRVDVDGLSVVHGGVLQRVHVSEVDANGRRHLYLEEAPA